MFNKKKGKVLDKTNKMSDFREKTVDLLQKHIYTCPIS